MDQEALSSGNITAQEDTEMKDKEGTSEHRNDDTGPLYLLCKSGEVPHCPTPQSSAVLCLALVKTALLTGSHG